MNKGIFSYATGLVLISLQVSAGLSTDPDHSHKEQHAPVEASHVTQPHAQSVMLSEAQQAKINLKLMAVQPVYERIPLYAPGELKANSFTSYVVTPRIDSVIERRHAVLGQMVKQGDMLVTLFSQDMAQAQADYLIAASEWQRVARLTDSSVSVNQQVVAKAQFKAAQGKLLAMGMSLSDIGRLQETEAQSLGIYTLSAQRSGIVLADNFEQGQRFEPGEAIMQLADESTLWVEVRLAATQQDPINTHTRVEIEHNLRRYPAEVIQQGHTLDPLTRTRVVRLQVDNPDDTLHAGMFVSAYFMFNTTSPVIAVPESALVRDTEGKWQVFVEHDTGEFVAIPVIRGKLIGDRVTIESASPSQVIEAGTRVVIQGAFFVASELAKSGFDPHNH
ncbi:efflux transporter periplasmic adaptor subunit [Pseudoalteromonas rubra]|uniref:Efflux transporter periplasmic adaptor subunit n=1 Tax=Pseudoalteromonas rubra TaxID=43658 RepID=A0A5S3WKQ3_9GAMM|nr:efflux RND transporter periplasmic adaptor subunit [Pseudoalteromonas rubra]TMP27492.1 efflux transporter periplasmic adaptor subunit [Pseudoalteromonas rubra]TMP28988.1 efflux transporter periplasmic adaptor subunit [Pseudoalteromonas rubra]